MYVCLCYAITEKKIKRIIEDENPKSVDELRRHCEAGNDCGCCLMQVEELLKTQRSASF